MRERRRPPRPNLTEGVGLHLLPFPKARTLEVVDFVQTTRRWYDRRKLREMQEKLDACQVFSLLLLYPHNFIDESIL